MVNPIQKHCCGCGACEAICNKSAITMREDAYGFIYPTIDSAKCNECGLCNRICPEVSLPALSEPKAVYAAHSKSVTEHASCASGGAATILGKQIIRQGGVVYGCSQENYRTIRHIRVDSEDDLDKLKGSKYVQSNMNTVYTSVQHDLKTGGSVLFIGTPCQVGALRSYLIKPYGNLTTVDLVCHGVPSQAMLRDTVEREINTYNSASENTTVNFRWKTQFGIQFGIQFRNNNGVSKSVKANQSAYMTAFLSGLSYRENCHNCRYARRERVSDITIGDFWGIGQAFPSSINFRHGVSQILVNTPNGENLWNAVQDCFVSECRTIDEAVEFNWNLHDPSPRPAAKDKFMEIYSVQGMNAAVRACNRRYRMEQTATVRVIRRVPLFNKTFRAAIRIVRKLF